MRLRKFHFPAVAALVWRRLTQFVREMDVVGERLAAERFNADVDAILRDCGWTRDEFRAELERRKALLPQASTSLTSDARR